MHLVNHKPERFKHFGMGHRPMLKFEYIRILNGYHVLAKIWWITLKYVLGNAIFYR